MKKVHVIEEFQTTFGHVFAIERLDGLKISDVIETDRGKHYVVKALKLSDSASNDNTVAVTVQENTDEE